MVGILGIVNVTRDSFSDGGRYLETGSALARARELVADGADVIDLGAESTHPDSEDVSARSEIERLTPLVEALVADGTPVSIDTVKPDVMRAMSALGADFLNDVGGMRDPEAVAAAAASTARVIVMFSRAPAGRAVRQTGTADKLLDELRAFFESRVAALVAAGVARDRIVLDPGMGYFLGSDPEPSLLVLRQLARLRAELELPLLVSTSRKSFLGAVIGRDVHERGAATLASELWAILQGVEWIRTHDVRALRDAANVLQAIQSQSDGK